MEKDEIPGYILNDPQAFIRFLEDCYRQRRDVVIWADDGRYLADALRERLHTSSDSGSLFDCPPCFPLPAIRAG